MVMYPGGWGSNINSFGLGGSYILLGIWGVQMCSMFLCLHYKS